MFRHLSYYLAMIESEEDKCKFEILYNKFHRQMFRKALSIVNKHQDLAEDALQEAFTYIAEHMEKIDNPDSEQTLAFLTIVTKHKAHDVLRKEQVRDKRHADYEELEEMAVPDFTEFVGNDTLAMALRMLPEKQRTALILHYVYGFDTKDIAAVFKDTVSTTNKTLYRAKEKLKNAVKEAERK